ncbi:MAG TPA: hypothetical protein VKL40_05560 [Candidatus Angelobacter sp.]|nr:hypothetical protein [Candidatus Angelobacter sp.]
MKARRALIVMLMLAANAVAATPSLIFTPTQVIFPPQAVGAGGPSKDITIQLSQAGTLTVTSTTASPGFAVPPNACAGNLAPGTQCPIPVSFVPPSPGPLQGTVSVSFVSSTAATQSVPVCGTALPGTGDFTVGFLASCFSSGSGTTSVFSLAVFPNAFSGTVTLSCVSASSTLPCSVSPSSVTLSGTTPVSITVTVGTTTARSPHPSPRGTLGVLGIAAIVLSCAIGRGEGRRAAAGLTLVVMLGASFIGCGATTTTTRRTVQANTVTITASGNAITHQNTLSLSPQ